MLPSEEKEPALHPIRTFLKQKIIKSHKKALQGSCQAEGDNAGMKPFDRLAAAAGAKATPLGLGQKGEQHQLCHNWALAECKDVSTVPLWYLFSHLLCPQNRL